MQCYQICKLLQCITNLLLLWKLHIELELYLSVCKMNPESWRTNTVLPLSTGPGSNGVGHPEAERWDRRACRHSPWNPKKSHGCSSHREMTPPTNTHICFDICLTSFGLSYHYLAQHSLFSLCLETLLLVPALAASFCVAQNFLSSFHFFFHSRKGNLSTSLRWASTLDAEGIPSGGDTKGGSPCTTASRLLGFSSLSFGWTLMD